MTQGTSGEGQQGLPHPQERPGPRELGLQLGTIPTGPTNTIVDVAGVAVGHATLIDDRDDGHVRTGVTVVLPHTDDLRREPVPAAVHTINGYGKPTGFEQVRELGELETPIALTSTLAVGAAHTGLVRHAIATSPGIGGEGGTVNPVVAECNDGYLNDAQLMPIGPDLVAHAMADASATDVRQGAVGAGTGTVAFGWKGGIGSSSRVVGGASIGVLIQTNTGRSRDLTIAGHHVGPQLPKPGEPRPDRGSVVIVLATDAPLDPRQLGRAARRVQHGLARVGCVSGHGSGEFVIAFSTAPRGAPVADAESLTDDYFAGVAEATEEAFVASMFCASGMSGRDGRHVPGLPVDEVLDLIA